MAIVDEAGVAIRADFTEFDSDVTKGGLAAGEEFGRKFKTGMDSTLPTKNTLSRVLPSDSQAASEGARTGRSFSTGFTGSLRNITQYASGYLIGNAVIGAVGKTFGAAKGAIFDFNSQLQGAQIAFTTMLGSGTKAQAFLSKLQQFARVTPFDFPGLVTASQRLLAYGFNAKQVLPALTSIGDAAAGLSSGAQGVERITIAIGQIQSKGRVQSDELLQLTEAGIPALKILANGFGVSQLKLQKMVTAGVIPASKAIPLLLTGMEKGTKGAAGETAKFGGLMAKQSKTFTGALSNIGDALNQTVGKAFLPFFNVASSGLQALATGLQSKAFSDFGKNVSAGLQTGINVIKLTMASLTGTKSTINVGGLTGPIQSFGKTARAVIAGVKPIFANLGKTISGSIIPAIKNIVAVLAPLAEQFAAVAGPAIIGAFQVLASLLANQIGPAILAVTGFLRDHAVAVRAIVTAVAAIAGVVAIYRAASTAVAIYTAVTKSAAIAAAAQAIAVEELTLAQRVAIGVQKVMTAATAVFNAVMDANPIFLVIAGLAGLAAGLIYAYKNSATFRKVVKAALDGVVTAFHAVVDAGKTVGSALVKAWDAIKGAALAVSGAVTGAFTTVVSAVKTAISDIAKVMATIVNVLTFPTRLGIALMLAVFFAGFNAIKGPVLAALNGIRTVITTVFGIYVTIIRTELTIILTVARAIWSAITTVFTVALGVIRTVVSTGWKAVTAVISTVGKGIAAVARAVWDKVIAGAKAVLSGLDAVIGKPFRAVVTAISGFGTKLKTAATTVFGKIKDAATAVVSDMAGIGEDIIGGVISGITGMASKLYGFITKFIDDNVPKPVRKLLGINSPSKVFKEIGINLIDGLTAGIKKQTGSLDTVLRTLTKRLQSSGESGVAAAVKTQIRNLDKLATERINVGKRLVAAQKSLADLQKQSKDFATQAAANILSTGDVTQFGSTFASIVTGLTASIAKAQSFAAAIKQLKGAGLNAASLSQLVAAGPSSGLAAAQAILTSGGIGQINSLQKQLTTAANSVGSVTSSAMFSAGISAAQGLVAGLKSQQKALTVQMRVMADSLVAEVKRKLGIHSPSTVFADVGVQTVKGLQLGVSSQKASLDSLMRGLVTVPAGGARAVATTPAPAAGASTAGRGTGPMTALAIENYYEAPNSSPYRTAQELAFIARGGGLTPAGAR